MFVLLQHTDRPFRHFGSHWPTGTQHKPGISSPSHPNRVINLQMLFCNHQRSSRVEGDRGRKGGKAELARGESSLLCPALAAPGPTPSPVRAFLPCRTSLPVVLLDCFSPSAVLHQQSDFMIPAQLWITSHVSGVKHKLFNIAEQVT